MSDHTRANRKIFINMATSELENEVTIQLKSEDDLPITPQQMYDAVNDYLNYYQEFYLAKDADKKELNS